MGQMFQGPKMPALPVTPPPPTLADANAAAQSQADALAKRKGRASTLLTGDRGLTTGPNVATKTLLGR